MNNTSTLKPIISNDESTVVAEFLKKEKRNSDVFQSEQQLENSFIQQLISNGYEYKKDINDEPSLLKNLRIQIQRLNKIEFNDNEWNRLFNEYICNNKETNIDKTEKIQTDKYLFSFQFDNNVSKNIKLIDKDNVHNNYLQVINQYVNHGKSKNRYDVTILVNGLPLIQVELKKRGVQLKEAFNQINRYKQESYSYNSKIFDYIQIFVISNGTSTKYFSNTVYYQSIKENESDRKKSNICNSFSFTNYWSDSKNNRIEDLEDFTETFFAKHSILNIVTKYCIFTSDKRLLVMRPYQIVAVEEIIKKVNISNNYPDKLGTPEAGGYVWHTTGSGKTVTSFKTAQLLTNLKYVDKVMFVVDRKDLDYQTMCEYDKFQKGAASSSSSTKELQNNIEDNQSKILITTIQKLTNFIKTNNTHEIYKKRCVLIFDECHRSQFGEMHQLITKHFKKSNIFGFTGTPIFSANASVNINTKLLAKNQSLKEPKFKIPQTTEQLFGKQLHCYNIIHAIHDENVLPWKFSVSKTFDQKPENDNDKKVTNINVKSAYEDSKRISLICEDILKNFNMHTRRENSLNNTYEYDCITNIDELAKIRNNKSIEAKKEKRNLKGFNSILAVDSIESAKKYYLELNKKMKENPDLPQLKIGVIYSYAANQELKDYDYFDGLEDENNESTTSLNESDKEFLRTAINDYNKMFNCNYSVDGDSFQSYYKDVSLKLKNRDLDMLIVVNMFLTGFDAPTLNTLFIDKELRMHGLIQAFSRTNRILNSIKHHGNIVAYREQLNSNLNNAIELFGNKESLGYIILRQFDEYYNGYHTKNNFVEGYKIIVPRFINSFSNKQLFSLDDKKLYITEFSKILSLRNILLSFEEFKDKELFKVQEFQDFISKYLEYYEDIQKNKEFTKTEDIADDIVFELEIVKENSVDIDFILKKINANKDKFIKDKELTANILSLVESSYELRSKKELIQKFIEYLKTLTNDEYDVIEELNKFNETSKWEELEEICKTYNTDFEKTKIYLNKCFENNEFVTYGSEYISICPKSSLFKKPIDAESASKKSNQFEKRILNFFNKYY